MKHALAPFAVLVLASSAFAPPGDELEFGVAKGTKLVKRFQSSLEIERKDVSMTIGGRDLPPELLEKIEMTFSYREEVEVEDEYRDIDGARAKVLARTFRKATKHSGQHMLMLGQEPKDEQEELESPLVDHTVVFTWNAEDEKYECAFQDEKGQEKWLEKLEQDMDFLCLLPEGELEPDQTWKIEPKDFDPLPGGKLAYEKKKDSENIDFDENLTGEVEAKYTGTREVEGQRLGVIAVTAKLSTQHQGEDGDGPSMKMEITFEVEGEYLWDLERKHLRSFEFHGPVVLVMSGEQEIEVNGQSLPMKMRFELAGEMRSKGEFGD